MPVSTIFDMLTAPSVNLRILAILVLGSTFAPNATVAQESVSGANAIPGIDHANKAGFLLTGRRAEMSCETCYIDNQLVLGDDAAASNAISAARQALRGNVFGLSQADNSADEARLRQI